jgi:hypothetical protein
MYALAADPARKRRAWLLGLGGGILEGWRRAT